MRRFLAKSPQAAAPGSDPTWPAEIPYPGDWYKAVGQETAVIEGGTTRTFTGTGTAENPIVYKGNGTQVFTGHVSITGSYVILDNVKVNGSYVTVTGNHLCLRNCEVYNYMPGGNASTVSASGNDIVFWKNSVHDNGDRFVYENDVHGFSAENGTYNVWIIDNDGYLNAGDSCQVGHGHTLGATHDIYVMWNRFRLDKENAVDVKRVHNFFIVENEFWGYAISATSEGAPIVLHYCPINAKVLRNTLHDSEVGVAITSLHSDCITYAAGLGVPIGVEISDNDIYDMVSEGIISWSAGSTLTIDGNRISRCGAYGIDMFNTAGSITNNVLADNASGITISPSGSMTHSGNTIDGVAWD